MTREEQIRFRAGSIADGCIAHGAPWKEYYQGFIEGAKWADANPSQPSLPSNIDEAADACAISIRDFLPPELDLSHIDLLKAFKAGSEWVAGQECNIDSYQKQARTFLLEKFQNMPMFELVKYCTLGLNEEAGEVAGKIKKSIRDADGEIDEGRIDAIVKEIGDVLWYLAIMAYSLGLPLSHIAQKKH